MGKICSSAEFVVFQIIILTFAVCSVCLNNFAQTKTATNVDRVKTSNGMIEGAGRQASGVRIFKGIPYAQPPIGELRWKPPQPVENRDTVQRTADFGPRCVQHPIFGDMSFRSNGMSEDCLYLNVWTPAKTGERLPVLVYFYGGGFIAGDGSELRYDGENMAAKGVVVVTLNYRLGVYGFFAHPELTKESPNHASGNYGLLDQAAAVSWVSKNIQAFGGDPKRITIGGESAGSFSVSAQMASPLAKNLISGAIGESGSIFSSASALPAVPLAQAEQYGQKFAVGIGANSLKELRAMTTDQLQEATKQPQQMRFPLTIDGYFLTESPAKTYADGNQSRVPLLIGWNSEESNWHAILGINAPTPENYEKAIRKLYDARADEVLKLYPGATEEQVISSATDLASDRFIAFSTWKWADMQIQTSGKPIYRYFFVRPRPAINAALGNVAPGLAGGVIKRDANAPAIPPATGAVHSAEIEYAFGNLSTNKVYNWTPDDYAVSKTMQEYFANFIKTGDPNGKDLPVWQKITKNSLVNFMQIDVKTNSEPEKNRARYLFLDKF